MAKLKSDPINLPDMLDYLNLYSDFSFELAILKMLMENGLKCEHGGHYDDRVTGKSRQFDIRATMTIAKYRIYLAVECKNIRDSFPVLISCIPRHPNDSYHEVFVVTSKDNPLPPSSLAKPLRIPGALSIYKPRDPVGKNIAQIGRSPDGAIFSNDAELYDKWSQSLNSAADLVDNAYRDCFHGSTCRLSMIIPFVVVPNNRLWSASYNHDGNRASDPQLVDRCSCFISKEYTTGTDRNRISMRLSHLEVVTERGMASFVDDHLKTVKGIAKLFPIKLMRDSRKYATATQD